MWNGFFDVSELDDGTLKQLFKEALAKSISSNVDYLKGFRRDRYETMTPEQYIETLLSSTTHNVVIDRSIYSEHWVSPGEISSCTLGESPELFLFIFLELDDLYQLVDKFNLKKWVI